MAYVYKHIRPDTNEIFYIGIGSKKIRATSKYNRNNYWNNIVNSCNGIFKSVIMFDNLTWEEACQKEIECIKQYGRTDNNTGILCNMTNGGEGILNLQHTDETKLKISIAAKKRYKVKPHCRKGQRFINRNSRKVVIMDLKTYIIYKFNTLIEVSLFLNTTASRVRRACIVSKSINNYYLKFGNTVNKKEIEKLKNKKIYDLADKSVINITKNYSAIQKKVINTETNKIYESISEVSKLYGIRTNTLSRYLNGVSKNKTIFKLL